MVKQKQYIYLSVHVCLTKLILKKLGKLLPYLKFFIFSTIAITFIEIPLHLDCTIAVVFFPPKENSVY